MSKGGISCLMFLWLIDVGRQQSGFCLPRSLPDLCAGLLKHTHISIHTYIFIIYLWVTPQNCPPPHREWCQKLIFFFFFFFISFIYTGKYNLAIIAIFC